MKAGATFRSLLANRQILLQEHRLFMVFTHGDFSFTLYKSGNNFPILPPDILYREPEKLLAFVMSRLNLNKRVFARKCEVVRLERMVAKQFFDTHHLMNYAQAAFHYGLLYKNDIVAVAAFSRGRKMNRLLASQRSYEMVRFCSASGITVTGGLTKLLAHFVKIQAPGDIMTYIDKNWAQPETFVKSGFKRMGETPPITYAVNKESYERVKNESLILENCIWVTTGGNIKLVYTP